MESNHTLSLRTSSSGLYMTDAPPDMRGFECLLGSMIPFMPVILG